MINNEENDSKYEIVYFEFDLYYLQEAMHILQRKDCRMQITYVHSYFVSVLLYELTIKSVHSSVNVFACFQQTIHDSTFCRKFGTHKIGMCKRSIGC